MEVQFAVAKIGKYATSESGDTLEMIERPHGGLSFVLVDGQRSGKSAKAISNLVARKAIQLLSEGVRDGAAARAAHDYLYTYRGGKGMATLNILSIDLSSRTCVITRNNPAPVILAHGSELEIFDEPVDPVGFRRSTRPLIREVPLEESLVVVMFTDGLIHAGDRHGHRMDVVGRVQELAADGNRDPRYWADSLLSRALELDENRPVDDISILVAATLTNSHDTVRRLWARMPL